MNRSNLHVIARRPQSNAGLWLAILFAAGVWASLVQPAGAAVIVVSPTIDHPSATVAVKGAGFAVGEAVDIYFDTTDELLVGTNSRGGFRNHGLPVPAGAAPGTHWITAIGRTSGDTAQKPFTVNTDWLNYRFNQELSGINPYENVLSNSTVSGLNTAWFATTTPGSPVATPGVASDGVLDIAYVGSGDTNFYAFNAATGDPIWSVATGGYIGSAPAIANGLVYFTSGDGYLYALSGVNGDPFWTAAIPGGTTPTISNGTLYVGDGNGNLNALNSITGAVLWSVNLDGNDVYSTPAVANGIVYVWTVGTRTTLYAVKASNGSVVWTQPGYFLNTDPVVANGVVYIGGYQNVYAFNAHNGQEIWSAPTETYVFGAPAVANGVVYAADDYVYALDAATGAKLWTDAVGFVTGTTVANGVVYVDSGYNNVYAFDAAYGTQLWSAATGASIYTAPVVTNGVVYVGSGDGNLYAYAINGDKLYNRHHSPPNFSSLYPDLRLKLQYGTP